MIKDRRSDAARRFERLWRAGGSQVHGSARTHVGVAWTPNDAASLLTAIDCHAAACRLGQCCDVRMRKTIFEAQAVSRLPYREPQDTASAYVRRCQLVPRHGVVSRQDRAVQARRGRVAPSAPRGVASSGR